MGLSPEKKLSPIAVDLLVSNEDSVVLSKRISTRLTELGIEQDTFEPVNGFLNNIKNSPGISVAGIIGRDIAWEPMLDVYLLLSEPLDVESILDKESVSPQSEQLYKVDEAHGQLAMALRPYLCSILSYVDPRNCPHIEGFQQALEVWCQEAKKAEVLTCCTIRN